VTGRDRPEAGDAAVVALLAVISSFTLVRAEGARRRVHCHPVCKLHSRRCRAGLYLRPAAAPCSATCMPILKLMVWQAAADRAAREALGFSVCRGRRAGYDLPPRFSGCSPITSRWRRALANPDLMGSSMSRECFRSTDIFLYWRCSRSGALLVDLAVRRVILDAIDHGKPHLLILSGHLSRPLHHARSLLARIAKLSPPSCWYVRWCTWHPEISATKCGESQGSFS